MQPIVCPGYVVPKDQAPKDESLVPTSIDGFDLDEDVDGIATIHTLGDGEITLDPSTDREARQLCVSLGSVSEYRDARSRGFAEMDRILGDGLCGAPVIDLSSRDGGKCLGLVEGVVPPSLQESEGSRGQVKHEIRRAIAGNAAFIYGNELIKLLKIASQSK